MTAVISVAQLFIRTGSCPRLLLFKGTIVHLTLEYCMFVVSAGVLSEQSLGVEMIPSFTPSTILCFHPSIQLHPMHAKQK